MNDYEYDHWFDMLVKRVRNMRAYQMTDTEVVTKLVESGQATAEQMWLAVNAAKILDEETT